MSKITILIICPFYSPNLGGVETHLDDLTGGLVKKGHKVYVQTYQPLTVKLKGLKLEKKNGLEISRTNWFGQTLFYRLEKYPVLQFGYLFPGLFWSSFVFMLKHSRKIDLIHAHGLVAASIAKVIRFFFHKKTIFTIHAIYGFGQRKTLSRLVKWILKDFDHIIALAPISKKDLAAAGLAGGKIAVIYQSVDQNLFKPKSKKTARRRLKLKNRFTVLFAGRLLTIKGVGLLLSAAKNLPKINFVLVGEGPEGKNLELRTRNLGLHNVLLVGQKSQRELANYYGAADVVAVPSLYEEGLSRVVLETLSSGRPLIVSNKGCLPKMVNSEVAVCLKPVLTELIEAINGFYARRQGLEQTNQKCRQYAGKHYGPKNLAKIIELYEN